MKRLSAERPDAARGQRRQQRDAETIGDLARRQAERRVVLVDDEPQLAGVDARIAQRVEQVDRRYDRRDALVADQPRLVGRRRDLRDELVVREPAEIDDLLVEERAQPVQQPDARRVRHVAQIGEVRRQRRQRDAARMAGQRGIDERAVDAAQVAHGLDEVELAARVEEQRAVARGQPEVDERGLPVTRRGRPARGAARRGSAVRRRAGRTRRAAPVQPHRQVRRERAHAHPGARAEQRDQLAVTVRRLAARVFEQRARDAQRVVRRAGHVDEIVHAGPQRGERAFRLGQRAERDHRQPRMRDAHRGGRRARRHGRAGKIDEDDRGIEPRDALRERARLERRGLHRAGRHQRLAQPVDVPVLL